MKQARPSSEPRCGLNALRSYSTSFAYSDARTFGFRAATSLRSSGSAFSSKRQPLPQCFVNCGSCDSKLVDAFGYCGPVPIYCFSSPYRVRGGGRVCERERVSKGQESGNTVGGEQHAPSTCMYNSNQSRRMHLRTCDKLPQHSRAVIDNKARHSRAVRTSWKTKLSFTMLPPAYVSAVLKIVL